MPGVQEREQLDDPLPGVREAGGEQLDGRDGLVEHDERVGGVEGRIDVGGSAAAV